MALAPALLAQTPRVAVPAGMPPSGRKSIWVLSAEGRLTQYDAADFRMWRAAPVPVPAEAAKHPEGLSISRTGEALFAYPADGQSSLRRLWHYSGRFLASDLMGGADERRPAPSGGALILSATPDVYFSADGQRLFWFETRVLSRSKGGMDVARDATFLAWSTGVEMQDWQPVAEFAFPKCACDTGTCKETCPEALVWAPPSGVSDFFFVTRWIPGQLGSTYQESSLYQFANGTWTAQKLPHVIEQVLDAGDHGNTYVEANRDSGCCGWENESDDTTSVTRAGSTQVIYDEWRRFHNENYDVSFFTANAGLSPDLKRVAYTLASTSAPRQEIRQGSSGKGDHEELARIQKAIAELPSVEVVDLGAPGKIVTAIPHAELIGWLDDARLLVLCAGELVVVETATGKQVTTGIKAPGRTAVWVR